MVTPEIRDYVRHVSLREDPILAELREFTAKLPAGRAMQVMAEEGRLLALLIRISGVAERIDLRIGDATQTLAALADERGNDSFDFAFIDADKANYGAYYEAAPPSSEPAVKWSSTTRFSSAEWPIRTCKTGRPSLFAR